MKPAQLPSPLRVREVLSRLPAGSRFGTDLRVLGEVSSTSELIRAAAATGGSDGMVIAAQAQRAGRGRRGTEWISGARDGLWFSALLRSPPSEPHAAALSPVLALAVADALKALHADLPLSIKWPNDVLIGGRKLAGILVEAIQRGQETRAAIVGVGINLRSPAWPAHGLRASLPPTDLAEWSEQPAGREALLAACLSALEARVAQLQDGAFEALERDWASLDFLAGRRVSCRHGDQWLEGRVERSTAFGGLELQSGGAAPTPLSAGLTHEITLLDVATEGA